MRVPHGHEYGPLDDADLRGGSNDTGTRGSTRSYPLTLHDLRLHDPYIVTDRVNDRYYLYNANYGQYKSEALGFGRSVLLYTSPDLVHWSEPSDVFDLNEIPADAWYDNAEGPWAPEVHQWRGMYVMIMTLHNAQLDLGHASGGPRWYRQQTRCHARGCVVAKSSSPSGPFTVLAPHRPVTPRDRMALDGTFFEDDNGNPWMVYAHEWVQTFDGTIEAVPLDPDDLSRVIGDPVRLWSASEGLWQSIDGVAPSGGWRGDFDTPYAHVILGDRHINGYVTDGPFINRTPDGSLACLWTSYSQGTYILSQALSPSGSITGPWRQGEPIDHHDAGHAMTFESLQGTRLLLMHTNMTASMHDDAVTPHGILYEVAITDAGYRLIRHRDDLDGITDPAHDV